MASRIDELLDELGHEMGRVLRRALRDEVTQLPQDLADSVPVRRIAYTTAEVGVAIGMSADFVNDLQNQGVLPYVQFGRTRLVRHDVLVEMLEQRELALGRTESIAS